MSDFRDFPQIYDAPQFYPPTERVRLIEKHLSEGLTLKQIGWLFGVTEQGIKYQWKRYKLGTYVKPKTKLKPPVVYVNYDNQHTENWEC